jgi:hypothetical protein
LISFVAFCFQKSRTGSGKRNSSSSCLPRIVSAGVGWVFWDFDKAISFVFNDFSVIVLL